ncbi:MAG: hypothetical protein KGL39_09185 [Patescibacteria group bacterium]|nr:hypothetical protein [Patescibacteria group bacterium]
MTIYERQQQRARATEARLLAEGGPHVWDAVVLRRQASTTARLGEVILRPFSRLARIEERVKP